MRVTTCVADVSREEDLLRFRDQVMRDHETDCVHLVFGNAGIGAVVNMIDGDQETWERTFDICWYGVCYGTAPSDARRRGEGHRQHEQRERALGHARPRDPHSAYVGKFAVRGFTEALINDLQLNAPHVKASVVMPGHKDLDHHELRRCSAPIRRCPTSRCRCARGWSAAVSISAMRRTTRSVRGSSCRASRFGTTPRRPEKRPRSSSMASRGRWRILVGDDAHVLDRMLREDPEGAYTQAFYDRLLEQANWRLGQLGGS